MVMTVWEWGFFAYLLLLAVPLAWLEIRAMARNDQNPEEELKWPEWWAADSRQSAEALEQFRRAA